MMNTVSASGSIALIFRIPCGSGLTITIRWSRSVSASASVRQAHRETPGVQELALEAAPLAALSIHRVANDRESRVCEVRADLVRAPRDRADVKKRPPLGAGCPRRDALETGRGFAPPGPD